VAASLASTSSVLASVAQIERSGNSNESVRQEAVLALLGFMQATSAPAVLERTQVQTDPMPSGLSYGGEEGIFREELKEREGREQCQSGEFWCAGLEKERKGGGGVAGSLGHGRDLTGISMTPYWSLGNPIDWHFLSLKRHRFQSSTQVKNVDAWAADGTILSLGKPLRSYTGCAPPPLFVSPAMV